jgi:hypothetical protein
MAMHDIWHKPFDDHGPAAAGTTHHDTHVSVHLTHQAFDSYPLQGDPHHAEQLLRGVLESDLEALPLMAEVHTDAGALEMLGYRRLPDGQGWQRTLEGPSDDAAAWTSFVREFAPRDEHPVDVL